MLNEESCNFSILAIVLINLYAEYIETDIEEGGSPAFDNTELAQKYADLGFVELVH